MKTEEVKFFLNAARPNGADQADPTIAEAMELAQRDAALQKWFEEQRAFDKAVASKLRQTPVPKDLRSSILAGVRINRPAVWWQQSRWLAVAAALVLAAIVGAVQFKTLERQSRTASLAEDLIRQGADGRHVEVMLSDLTAIKDWLKSQQAPAEFSFPQGLAKASAQGCRVLQWQGRKVTLVCFHLPQGEHLDLFVMDASPNADSSLTTTTGKGIATATWTRGRHTYVLAGKVDAATLRNLASS
ncbi:MAG: hypothetical protein ACO1QS_11705 [Verrucomicrobiota bacterium]